MRSFRLGRKPGRCRCRRSLRRCRRRQEDVVAPLPSRVSSPAPPLRMSLPQPPVRVSLPSPPKRFAVGRAPLVSSRRFDRCRPSEDVNERGNGNCGSSAGYPTAPPLTRMSPAASRVTAMWLFRHRPGRKQLSLVRIADGWTTGKVASIYTCRVHSSGVIRESAEWMGAIGEALVSRRNASGILRVRLGLGIETGATLVTVKVSRRDGVRSSAMLTEKSGAENGWTGHSPARRYLVRGGKETVTTN